MLLDLKVLVKKYDLKLKGVLHVGAHLAEEAALYAALGISNVWWIEGNADNIPPIRAEVSWHGDDEKIVLALIGDEDGKEVTFNNTIHDSMSSSLLEFGTHSTF